MPKKRELDNWLSAFLEWTLPRSEAPESMIRWTGLFSIAAIMKRKVWWSRELLGAYEIFPTLYIIFVGKPAVVRKSTTIGFTESLLYDSRFLAESTETITFSGDITSYSKLLGALSESPDSSVTIVSGEFSSLIQTTPEEMYQTLIDLFDNKVKTDWNTWKHGDHRIEKPTVNLIAATTPAWIADQPPQYFVGGGFASRVLFVFEEKPRQREIFYDHLDQGRLKVLEASLILDLETISGVEGVFGFDSKKTKEYIRSWYKDQDVESEDERTEGYYGRKHTHGLKTAMLLSLCERSDRKVTRKHWNEAIAMLDYLETRMSRAFSTLGSNPYSVMMEELLAYIKLSKKTDMKRVAGRFYNSGYTLEQLGSALAFLKVGGKIESDGGLGNPTYTFKGD